MPGLPDPATALRGNLKALIDPGVPADVRFAFDLPSLAHALGGLPQDVTAQLFSDGRRTSVVMEHLLINHLEVSEPASSNDSFDVSTPHGNAEVRCLTGSGLSFAPSVMTGAGREFEEGGFIKKLAAVTGFYICDIRAFPEVRVSIVPSREVSLWWSTGDLGKNAKRSAKVARKMIDEMLQRNGVRLV